MFLCTDRQLQKVREVQRDIKIIPALNSKHFRAADTILSYRQLNELGKDHLLNDDRDNERGWRKYSFKELLYFKTAAELKLFGLDNERLKPIHELFFTKSESGRPSTSQHTAADDAICLTLMNVQVMCLLVWNGFAYFAASPQHEAFQVEDTRAAITVNITKLLNELLKEIGVKQKVKNFSLVDLVFSNALSTLKVDLSKKERELIQLIRQGECEKIEVVQQNGKVKVIRALTKKRGKFDPTDLLKVMEAKSYQTVTAHMQNGKVVTYTVEETKI